MGLEWAFSGLDVEFWVELQESQDQKHVGGGQITTLSLIIKLISKRNSINMHYAFRMHVFNVHL